MFKIKRIYEPPEPGDGFRVLVDRLWPRGVRREAAALDGWHKEVAPSDDLRRWFDGDELRWPDFVRRYRAELEAPEASAALADLRARAASGVVTLLYAKRNEARNNATALRDFLEGRDETPAS